MANRILVLVIMAAGIILLIWIAVLSVRQAERRYCQSDSDCIPATCCHPAELVNRKYAPDCTGELCTEACIGPLDCRRGEIRCIDSRCRIIPANVSG
ncbi:Uncharacterised protein [uncultured archaeon]|nr:Uncharacterised protein [uncultured archaeon]